MEVFTEEWAAACRERLNGRGIYAEAGATWEWPVVLVMTADASAGVPEKCAVYLDLHRGECRGTRLATAEDEARAPYVLSASPAGWREILLAGTDPVAALMRGQLKLVRGNLFQMSKQTAAAREMTAAAADVGGVFPST